MKLKIYDENSINDVDDQLFLKLKYDREHVLLSVVDKDGEEIEDGVILCVDNDYRSLVVFKRLNELVPLKTSVIDSYPLIVTDEDVIKEIEKEFQKEFHNKMLEKHEAQICEHASKH